MSDRDKYIAGTMILVMSFILTALGAFVLGGIAFAGGFYLCYKYY